jgi:cardiolipin synthase
MMPLDRIVAKLKEAARHVKVYILLDGFLLFISKEVADALRQSGVHFRYFSPFFSANSFYIGRRLHHKNRRCSCPIIGGINIANKYHGKPGKEPWLDYGYKSMIR